MFDDKNKKREIKIHQKYFTTKKHVKIKIAKYIVQRKKNT